jgi:hypothetical protein
MPASRISMIGRSPSSKRFVRFLFRNNHNHMRRNTPVGVGRAEAQLRAIAAGDIIRGNASILGAIHKVSTLRRGWVSTLRTGLQGAAGWAVRWEMEISAFSPAKIRPR